MTCIRAPTNCQAVGLNHSSRGQRPRKRRPSLLRTVRATQKAMLPSHISPMGPIRPIQDTTTVSSTVVPFPVSNLIPRIMKPIAPNHAKSRLIQGLTPQGEGVGSRWKVAEGSGRSKINLNFRQPMSGYVNLCQPI